MMNHRYYTFILLLLAVLLCFTGCRSDIPAGEDPAAAATSPTLSPTKPPAAPTVPATEPTPTEPIGTLSLDISEITLWSKGMSRPVYNGTIHPALVSFESSNEEIATFCNGVITAVGPGIVTLSASYADRQISCTVTCSFPPEPDRTAQSAPKSLGHAGHGSAADAGTYEVAKPDFPQPPQPTHSAPSRDLRDPVLDPPEVFAEASSFFDDAAFLGDSVSVALANRALSTGELGNALFLPRVSYGLGNAVYSVMLLNYQGQEMAPEDVLAQSGVKKVFIMLGMNDIALYGVDQTMEHWEIFISRIREKCPDIQIYIQSMTPIWTGGEKGELHNPRINAYNARLPEFAAEHGCYYIDIHAYMVDSTGGLASRYTSDNYVHLSADGAQVWIDILKAYACY